MKMLMTLLTCGVLVMSASSGFAFGDCPDHEVVCNTTDK